MNSGLHPPRIPLFLNTSALFIWVFLPKSLTKLVGYCFWVHVHPVQAPFKSKLATAYDMSCWSHNLS